MARTHPLWVCEQKCSAIDLG